ncbi:MAG: hypothetical protein ACXWUG_30100 [Polyangiales bacterium]
MRVVVAIDGDYRPPRSHLWPFAALSLVGLVVGLVFAWIVHRRRR